MKMLRLRYLTPLICAVFIVSAAVSGVDEKKAVGDQVSFCLDKPLPPPVTSIIWKHINSDGITVKAIEWDDEGFNIPNPRFKDITTLDVKTGQITITNLNFSHSGVYTIDINSKEQEQKFTLTVMKPVPKPKIEIEASGNPDDVVYLKCKYSETIIWKDSTGETLTGSDPQSITVRKKGNPENFYTCTLKNTVSEETSDPVYERDLFKEQANTGLTVGIVFVVLIIFIILILLYFFVECFHEFVNKVCPCTSSLDCRRKMNDIEGQGYTQATQNSNGGEMDVNKGNKDDIEGQGYTQATQNSNGGEMDVNKGNKGDKMEADKDDKDTGTKAEDV